MVLLQSRLDFFDQAVHLATRREKVHYVVKLGNVSAKTCGCTRVALSSQRRDNILEPESDWSRRLVPGKVCGPCL